jgi:TPR repeat protein
MRQVTLAYAYILVLWGLASTQSAVAACDPEFVPLVGSAQLVMQSASIGAADLHGQRDAGISLTDALPSADRDRREAVNRLAIMYARGRGLPKKPRLALKLFRTMAMEGYTPAMLNLGTIYELGLASRRDHPRAYAWIRAALTLGVPEKDRDATNFKLGMIAARLGTAQTRAAERLATGIIQAVVVQCERGGERYIDSMLTGDSGLVP